MTMKTVPTTNGPRSSEDVVQELFVLARSARTDLIDGTAFANGIRDGEHIEIRVTVRSPTWVEALNSALQMK